MIHKRLQPRDFARDDTKAPLRFALSSMLGTASLAIGLLPIVGWIAVAIAASVSAWVTTILLWISSKRFGQAAHVLKTSISRIRGAFLGSLAMGIILWVVNQNFYVSMETSSERVFFAFGLICLGATTYLVVVFVLKAFPRNLEKVYEKKN